VALGWLVIWKLKCYYWNSFYQVRTCCVCALFNRNNSVRWVRTSSMSFAIFSSLDWEGAKRAAMVCSKSPSVLTTVWWGWWFPPAGGCWSAMARKFALNSELNLLWAPPQDSVLINKILISPCSRCQGGLEGGRVKVRHPSFYTTIYTHNNHFFVSSSSQAAARSLAAAGSTTNMPGNKLITSLG